MDSTRGTSFADHQTVHHRGYDEFLIEFYTDTAIRLVLEDPCRQPARTEGPS